MAPTPVTPVPGAASYVVTGGSSVLVVAAGPNGGIITNPLANTDQGLSTAEVLYVDPVGQCGNLAANGTTFALQPGQNWLLIPGQTTPTYVNAPSSGHKFSVTSW